MPGDNREVEPKPVTPPELIFDEMIPAETQAILRGLQGFIALNPERASKSLDLYMAAPEAVGRTVEFLRQDPEGGMVMLNAWSAIFTPDMLDLEIDFDSTTKDNIKDDKFYTAAFEAFQKTNSDVERNRFRFRRWRKFINRFKEAA